MADSGKNTLKPNTINTHLANVYPALAMMAGMQLEVFTAIGDGRRSVADIADEIAVAAGKLQPLLYALVDAGLLEIHDGLFANNAEAREFLIKGQPRYIGSLHSAYSDLWASTMHTAESIRTGIPQAKHDFARMSYDELNAFVRGLDAGAGAAARRLHDTYDMSRFRRVLDAGGGSGGVAIGLVKLCPELRATVAELPNVARVTRDCVAESDYRDRLEVIDADLVSDVPDGRYDAVIMRALLQVLSASEAAAVVRHVAAALEPQGELFAFGRMLDDSRLSPSEAVAVNVMFLNVYDHGQAYTESEYRQWFEDAGLIDIVRTPIAGGYSIMRGVQP